MATCWGGGLLFSFLFIWVVCSVFGNSITPPVWDEDLQIYVRKSGTTVHWRSEGWADIPVGPMGLDVNDAVLLESGVPCFALWGDSHVDALQVPSDERAVGLFNSGGPPVKVIAVGGGGLNVADYYFRIPRLQRKYPNIVGNVILLSGMADVIPGKTLECHSRFLPGPWRFEESLCAPTRLALKYAPLLSEMRLGFLQSLYSKLKNHDFRFVWGPETAVARPAVVSDDESFSYEEAWNYLLTALKREGRGRLAFIYIPPTPQPAGNVVRIQDPEAPLVKRFGVACAANGIDFVDLSRNFQDLYLKQGLFPRGFFNTAPGRGHLNVLGHRLVAKGVQELLKGSR